MDIMALSNVWDPPSVIVLISVDRDFSYAMSSLCHQGYSVVIISLPDCTHASLKAFASATHDWYTDVLGVAPQNNGHATRNGTHPQSRGSMSSSTLQTSDVSLNALAACFTPSPPKTLFPIPIEPSSLADPPIDGVQNSSETLCEYSVPTSVTPAAAHVPDSPPSLPVVRGQRAESLGSPQDIQVFEPTKGEVDTVVSSNKEQPSVAPEIQDYGNEVSGQVHDQIEQDQEEDVPVMRHLSVSKVHPFSSVGSTPTDVVHECIHIDNADVDGKILVPSPIPSRESVQDERYRLEQMQIDSPRDALKTTHGSGSETPQTELGESTGRHPSHNFDAMKKLDKFLSGSHSNHGSPYVTCPDFVGGVRVEAVGTGSPSDPFADPVVYNANDLPGTSSYSNDRQHEPSAYGEAESPCYGDFEHDHESSSRSSSPEYVTTQRTIEESYFFPSESVDIPSLPVDIPLSSDDDDVASIIKPPPKTSSAFDAYQGEKTSAVVEEQRYEAYTPEPPSPSATRQEKGVARTDATSNEPIGYSSYNSTFSGCWDSRPTPTGHQASPGYRIIAESRPFRPHETTSSPSPVISSRSLGRISSAHSSAVSFHSIRSDSSGRDPSERALGKRPAAIVIAPPLSAGSYSSSSTETEIVYGWQCGTIEPATPERNERSLSSCSGSSPKTVPVVLSTFPDLSRAQTSPDRLSQQATVTPLNIIAAATRTKKSPVQTVASTSRVKTPANVQKFKPLIDVLRLEHREGRERLMSSDLGGKLLRHDANVYKKAGVNKLKLYLSSAQEAGVVSLHSVGIGGEIGVSLKRAYVVESLPPPPVPRPSSAPVAANILMSDTKESSNFGPLIAAMKLLSPSGHVVASILGSYLIKQDSKIYQKAGVSNFSQYMGKAESIGLVQFEGEHRDPKKWVVPGRNARLYGLK